MSILVCSRGSACVSAAAVSSPCVTQQPMGRVAHVVEPGLDVDLPSLVDASGDEPTDELAPLAAAMASVEEAFTTGANSSGTTNIVRRMPSIRRRVRSS